MCSGVGRRPGWATWVTAPTFRDAVAHRGLGDSANTLLGRATGKPSITFALPLLDS
jgi:hypothetical protein